MHPIKLGDLVFQLANQTKQCLDLDDKHQLNGRALSIILYSDIGGGASDQSVSLHTAVDSLVNEKFKGLEEETIDSSTSAISEDLQASIPHTSQELQRRIKAYDVLSESMQGISSKKIALKISMALDAQKEHLQQEYELIHRLEELGESYHELAQRAAAPDFSVKELNDEDKLLLYELCQEKQQLDEIEKSLNELGIKAPKPLQELKACIDKIQKEPFIEAFEKFNALKRKLSSDLSQEPDDFYLKKLINYADAVKKVMSSHPLDQVQGRLPDIDSKGAFYCMVKFQDEIRELFEYMEKNNITDRSIKKSDLKNLVDVVSRLEPLKKLVATPTFRDQNPLNSNGSL